MTWYKDRICYKKWLITSEVITDGQTTRGHADTIKLPLYTKTAVKFPSLFFSGGDYISLETARIILFWSECSYKSLAAVHIQCQSFGSSPK
jgi:hypothetical protein